MGDHATSQNVWIITLVQRKPKKAQENLTKRRQIKINQEKSKKKTRNFNKNKEEKKKKIRNIKKKQENSRNIKKNHLPLTTNHLPLTNYHLPLTTTFHLQIKHIPFEIIHHLLFSKCFLPNPRDTFSEAWALNITNTDKTLYLSTIMKEFQNSLNLLSFKCLLVLKSYTKFFSHN